MKLNLGCGQNKLDNFINVDKHQTCIPDMVWDLEVFPWPFESNSIDEIVLHHSLEHMGAQVDIFLGIMQELYRICMSDAKLKISVPHHHCDAFHGDPTHD